MRFGNQLFVFAIVCALAGQGVVPGLVLCKGEEGHVALEAIFDQCCDYPPTAPAQPRETRSMEASDHGAQGGCGPCSDTPFLVNPSRLPSDESNTNLFQTARPIMITGNTAGRPQFTSSNWPVPIRTAFTHIETSVLLI